MKYKKKALIVAEQFDGSDEMIDKYDIDVISLEPGYQWYELETLEGDMNIQVGDWIATGAEGEYYAINKDIFNKTYEPAE